MRTYKQKAAVPGGHSLEIRLPGVPSGAAEVVALSPRRVLRAPALLDKPHPTLGKIVFHEDASLPLDPEDWPEF